MNISLNSVINTLASKAKALALNVSEIELKVLDATNEEPWGPHGKDMQEIARAAEDPEKYNLIMNVLSERLQMRDENWRLCYKALLLIEYLIKHGPWRVVEELNRSVSSLERLRDDFEYKDAQGRDQGINVRQRAGEIAALVSNLDRVRQEREKAARNAAKYKGISSADARGFGGFGSGGGSGSNSNVGNGSSGGSSYGYSGFGGGFGGGAGSRGSQPQRISSGTESVHVPSTYRSGAASAGPTGGSGSGRRGDEGFRPAGITSNAESGDDSEDPFEATRRRIERLKAEGALPEAAPPAPPPGLADPPTAGGKVPKKLSDIKINPAVAATFASISIPSSSSTGNLSKLAPPPPPPPGARLVQQQEQQGSSNSIDLFGDSTPSPLGPPVQPATSASNAAESVWDVAFDAAPAEAAMPAPATAPAAAADPFASFGTAPAAQAPASGFDDLFGSSATSFTISAPAAPPAPAAPVAAPPSQATIPPARAPLPLDAFSEHSEPSAAGSASTDLFAAFAASAGPSTTSISAVSVSVSTMSVSTMAAAGAPAAAARPGPAHAPAGAGDPFAELTGPRKDPQQQPMAAVVSRPVAMPAFDAFNALPTARTPQPAVTAQQQPAGAGAGDPFTALASSSAPTAIATSIRSLQQPTAAAAAAAPFDPFGTAPVVPTAPVAPATARPAAFAFDAFSTAPLAASASAPPTSAVGSTFDAFFGTCSTTAGTAPTRPTAAASDPFADAFGAPTGPSFSAHSTATRSAATPPFAAANGAGSQMAMNKSGAAHGSTAHKPHDPFAGLGF